ncbi:MAG: EamA family transporter [Chloroflexi bacterium]|nr:EamA family transporter [Chloroflexota bacterium]MBI3340710.1 EamA family transporter [Chloroflexota bacterium]
MKTKIWTALIALYIVWGSTYLAIRFAVETIPPFFHAGIRFLVSGIILLIWRRMAGDPAPTQSQWRSTAIVGIALLLGGNGLVAWAEQKVPSGIAALMVSMSPMWLVLFEALRPNGVKPSWRGIIGLLIGFGGVFLLIGPENFNGTSATQFDTLGTIALLMAALLWSLGSIFSKTADMPKSSLQATGMEMMAGALALFVVSAGSGELNGFSFASVSMRSWLGLAYLITFGSLVGFVSYGWLLQNAPISLMSTYAYVNPVVAVFLGSWLASEPITARILIAAGIIIGSVFIINSGRNSKSEKEPGQVPIEEI